MKAINVQLVKGHRVRLEGSNVPMIEGQTYNVAETQHYLRREKDGAVVVLKEEKKPKKASRQRAAGHDREGDR